MTVAIIEARSCETSFSRCRPEVAFSGSAPQAAKVALSCSSRSIQSVTSTMRGLIISVSSANVKGNARSLLVSLYGKADSPANKAIIEKAEKLVVQRGPAKGKHQA